MIAVAAFALGAALPAAASAAPLPDVSATLLLQSPDAAATQALATAGALSRTERLQRLAATMPSASVRAGARRAAVGLGLTVDATTPWSITVHGSRAAVAAATAAGSSAAGSVQQASAQVPGVASVVVGGGSLIHTPMTHRSLTGADFRSVYAASSAPLPAGTPAPVVATLQYAGWNSAELAQYASDAGLPAPAADTFTAISVDGASTTTNDANDGAGEVALDQESIYSTIPYAKQRAYFTPNGTLQNDIDAYNRIAADVVAGADIVALSISWGECEQTHPSVAMAEHAALTGLVAAGVTVFSSSGDDGSFCRDGSTGVSFPASDPSVISVGGTTLDVDTQSETGWGGFDPYSAVGFSGSGGGRSTFARPAYQAGVAASSAVREVPDIAADADPDTGFDVWHDSNDGYGAGPWATGGTSLASPVSAALLTAELASRGVSTGLGDIHGVLYSAPAGSFRDVTAGTNGGYNAVPGYDMVTGLGAPNWHAIVDRVLTAPTISVPAYTRSKTVPVTAAAPAGQSFVAWSTGVGTPPACGTSAGRPTAPASVTVPGDGVYTVWAQGYVGYSRCLTATATVVVDTKAPSVSAKATQSAKTKKVSFTWGVGDATSGAGTTTVYVLRNGKRVATGSTDAAGKIVLARKAGSLYQLVVTGTDKAGNAAKVVKALSVPYDDTSFTFGKGWKRASSKAALGGKIASSATKNASGHVKAYGATFSLLTTTGPTSGIVAVYVNGKHVHDISLYSKKVSAQHVVKLASFKTAAVRTVTLVVKGTKAKGAKGVVVNVDGLVAS